MSTITIREAIDDDAEELSFLILENASHLLRQHYSDEQWRIFQAYYATDVMREKIRTQKIFCAVEDAVIVGSIGLSDDFVIGFYTRLTHRGRGVGKLLMDHLIQYAATLGLSELQLAASPEGVGFYLKNGWERVRDVEMNYYGVLFRETLMRKKLVGDELAPFKK